MRRRLRGDVVEGERPLVLVDALGGDLAAQDLGEDVGAVVYSHGMLLRLTQDSAFLKVA